MLKRRLLLLAVCLIASMAVLSSDTHAASFCSPFTNCFRDSDCAGVNGFCRNRVCNCPASEATPVCGDRCDSMPYCPAGFATCGGHSVSVNGNTAHVTDCRGIGSGAGGGVISYCDSSGKITGRCIGWPNPRIEIRWSPSQPPGAPPPNSNSILRDVNGTGNWWLYGGGPNIWGTRINGQPADPNGSGGYPNPNFTVYDLRDTDVYAGNTYTYKAKYRPETPSINVYQVTVNSANCGGPPPTPPPPANHLECRSNACVSITGSGPNQCAVNSDCIPITHLGCSNNACVAVPGPGPNQCSSNNECSGAGRIFGVCRWVNGSPEVHLNWSQYPPPNQGAANSNGLQKGDSFPNDPNRYWEFLPSNPSQYTFVDRSVNLNTQYQYRVKYRPDLPSINTYNIFVSVEECGGPAATPGPLIVSPTFQTAPPNVTSYLSATGGTGTYSWSAPGGTISGSGATIGVVFTNGSTQAVNRTVTVTSGGQTANATVQVEGVATFQDSIDLTGASGNRFLVINDNEPVTPYFDVNLQLAHGFTSVATDSVQVQLSNRPDDVASMPKQKFEKFTPWNLCEDQSLCAEGQYTVYAIYSRTTGPSSGTVFDNIVYTVTSETLPPSVLINGGALATDDRQVSLQLEHGFGFEMGADEIFMRIANRPDLVAAADPVAFTPTLTEWDLCAGLGATCANGTRSVFVQYCARGQCKPVVLDSIQLMSAWPDWGIRINDDAPSTGTGSVQLRLNPWFDRTGTQMFIGNLADLSDATTRSFSPLVPWDLCTNRPQPCLSDTYPVYVRYVNRQVGPPSFPEPVSPDYEDVIALTTVSPTPVPTPAAILINNGDAATDNRVVTLGFSSPFVGGGTVSLRAVNEQDLSQRDRDVIATEFNGGIASQPATVRDIPQDTAGGGALRQTQATPAPVNTTSRTLLQVDFAQPTGLTELESGQQRPFTPTLGGWDLCASRAVCPFGTYQIFAQFYRPATVGAVQGTLAQVGDEASWVYFDTIDYAATTPTPTPTLTPTPIPTATGTPGPSGTPPPCVGDECACEGDDCACTGPDCDCVGSDCDCTGPFCVCTGPDCSCTGDDCSCTGPSCGACVGPDCACTGPACVCTGPDCDCTGPFCVCAGPDCSCTGSDCDCTGPLCEIPCVGPFCGIIDFITSLLGPGEPFIATLALASAVAVLISAIATIVPLLGPGLFSSIWQSFLSLFGILPKRKKVWGTIYDSQTKRPIAYAKVQLLDRNRRVLETRVADKEGRYGFLATPESLQAQNVQIIILPSAPGYTFPSKATPTIDTFVYNNLYYGDLIVVNEKTLINFDVPMDPIKPRAIQLLNASPSIALGAGVAFIADAGFWLGLIMVPLSFILNPNPFTLGTLALFLGTASLRLWGISEHPFGKVVDASSGKAMAFALVTLNDPTGKRVAFAVSDEQGRYFLVVEKGTYELAAFTSAMVQPPRQSKQTINAKKGWITREIKL